MPSVFDTPFRRAAALALLWFPTAPPAAAQVSTPPAEQETAPATLEERASVEGITEYRLSNGLRVLLFPDESKQTTTVNVTYFVGSRHEAYGEKGMAHLLEHLLFKGTPDHPNIPDELTEHGANSNGTTWFDRTNYYETFAASPENLAWALELEADRMVNSFVSAEDLASEMTVVRNEFELGENSPRRVLRERVLAAAYRWHNYGHSTIGARSDIENVPIDRLKAFYRKYYQPDNAMLVVAGRFDEERALELVRETFGAIPRPERTGAMRIYPTYTSEPTQDGEREVTLRRVGDVQLVTVAYHVPPGAHEDFAAVDILTHVLGTEPSGRLYRALVEPGLAAEVRAYNFQLREPGVLLAEAEVRMGDSLRAVRDSLLATIDRLAVEPPTEEEVERARNALLKQMELAYNDPERIARELTEWAAIGDWRLRFLHRDRLETVTPEEVARVADSYLKPSNRTVGLFVPVEERPARAEIPERPNVDSLVASYRGREDVARGEAFEPTPEVIEARTTRAEYPNGFELALLPKETRGDAVVVEIQMRLGSEEALRGRATAGALAAAMLMRGTERHTRQELQDEFDRLKADVSVSGSADFVSARAETTRDNILGVLELLGEVLREPSFPEEEFRLLKEERLASLESQLSEPTSLASRRFSRLLTRWPEDHPEYVPTLEEQIERVESASLQDVRRFWEDFSGAGGTTMAVVGDFDPEEVRAAAEEIFADWTASEPYERYGRPAFDVPAEHVEIETPDKANAIMLAGFTFPMRDEHPDYPALVLANYMFGGGFLNSRLATRIRQRDGLSYGVGSGFSAHPIDRRASFTVYAIFAPQNASKVERAFREELARVVEEGFTEEEVEAAKRGWLQGREIRRAQDDYLASSLGASLFYDRPVTREAELERRVSELAPAEIREVVRRHLDPAEISVVMAGDFAGAAGEGAGGEESGSGAGSGAGGSGGR